MSMKYDDKNVCFTFKPSTRRKHEEVFISSNFHSIHSQWNFKNKETDSVKKLGIIFGVSFLLGVSQKPIE